MSINKIPKTKVILVITGLAIVIEAMAAMGEKSALNADQNYIL